MRQTTYEAKKSFVTHELSRCIAASHPGVVKVEYHIHGREDGLVDEVALIRFANGYLMRVYVTGRDIRETLRDVLAALEAMAEESA